MSLIKDVEVLRSIPIFAKIEPAKLKLLAFTSERLRFMDGDEIAIRAKSATPPTSSSTARPTCWSIPPEGRFG